MRTDLQLLDRLSVQGHDAKLLTVQGVHAAVSLLSTASHATWPAISNGVMAAAAGAATDTAVPTGAAERLLGCSFLQAVCASAAATARQARATGTEIQLLHVAARRYQPAKISHLQFASEARTEAPCAADKSSLAGQLESDRLTPSSSWSTARFGLCKRYPDIGRNDHIPTSKRRSLDLQRKIAVLLHRDRGLRPWPRLEVTALSVLVRVTAASKLAASI